VTPKGNPVAGPPAWTSAVLAVVVGVAVWWLCTSRLADYPELRALDFTYAWRAAGHLLAGRNPYDHMPAAPYTQGGLFLYPLTTAMVPLPFATLSAAAAGALFIAISAGLLAAALSREGYWRLTAFLSPSWLLAYWNIQWAPLVMASALLPALGWVGMAKPNLGIIAFAYRPRWSTAITSVAFICASLIWMPGWPGSWLATLSMQESPHDPPFLWPLGFIGLAGLLRWRTREGRTLVAASLLPAASFPYDQLMLWLVVRNWRESIALVATSWAAWLVVLATSPHDLTRSPRFGQAMLALGFYWPAAITVLRRPNVGAAPAWIERMTKAWPEWLRGMRA
jgi:MYXO-CTERM domain-containing protein